MSSYRYLFALPIACVAFIAAGFAMLPSPREVRAETPQVHYVHSADVQAVPLSAGSELFETNCAACHGPKGDGDGPAAAALDPKPRTLSSKELRSKVSDERIAKVIKDGGAANGLSATMPPWSQFTDAQIKSLVAHIRTLCSCKYTP